MPPKSVLAKPGHSSDAGRRRDDIVRAADALISELGSLPLPITVLGKRAGVTRTLLYSRFESQHALVNEVIRSHFDKLSEAGIAEAVRLPDLSGAANASAAIYLRHIADNGASLHIALREDFMVRQLEPGLRQTRDRLFRALCRTAARELNMPAHEVVVATQMLLSIPEEVGRVVLEGELPLDEGLKLCSRLLSSGIEALRPNVRPAVS